MASPMPPPPPPFPGAMAAPPPPPAMAGIPTPPPTAAVAAPPPPPMTTMAPPPPPPPRAAQPVEELVAPVPGAVPMPAWQPPAEELPPLPALIEGDYSTEETEYLPAIMAESTGIVPVGPINWDTMSMEDIVRAQGIEGLDFNQFGVLPVCSLNQGQFRLTSGESLGTEFVCVVNAVKAKYLYKTTVGDRDPNHAVAFSYDKRTSNGRDLQEILAGWAAKGTGYEIKNYLELTAVLDNGRVILVSVPQTSISRFTAHVVQVTVSRRLLSQVRTRVFIAPQVTKAIKAFNPIGFDVASPID